MKIYVFLAVCLACAICASGCTQPAIVPNTTTEPTPTLTATPTPVTSYLTLVTSGNTEVVAGKNSITAGTTALESALRMQGQTVEVQNILMQAQANYTTAKDHFTTAQSDYTEAMPIAPEGLALTLNTMTGTLPADIRACDTYLEAVTAAQHFDWYNASNLLNQANLQYQSSMQVTDQLLALLMVAT